MNRDWRVVGPRGGCGLSGVEFPGTGAGLKSGLTAHANDDDGDPNIGQSVVSNRVDWPGEPEAGFPCNGIRVGAAARYDQIIKETYAKNSLLTSDLTRVDCNKFTDDLQKRRRRDA